MTNDCIISKASRFWGTTKQFEERSIQTYWSDIWSKWPHSKAMNRCKSEIFFSFSVFWNHLFIRCSINEKCQTLGLFEQNLNFFLFYPGLHSYLFTASWSKWAQSLDLWRYKLSNLLVQERFNPKQRELKHVEASTTSIFEVCLEN